DWNRIDNLPENDWSRSVSSIAFLNHAVAIVVFSRDGERVRAISCRRPDIPIIAVSNDEMVANQLCLSRGVFPIYSPQIFGQRDAHAALDIAGIARGKIVIADAEEITLKEI
ncbi:MAG: hypothetical protein LBR41_00800, partial [Rickettsiales bacterium]|nr:hypothetical protein [Rickettsiales bacterium]